MIQKKSWKEFQDAGLLWWVNRALHLFGWNIVFECDEADNIVNVYPARCSWRGFTEDVEEKGFERLTEHLWFIADDLRQEVTDPETQRTSPSKVEDVPVEAKIVTWEK